MFIPTDQFMMLRDLGAYAYGTAAAELADKLQHLQGAAGDRIFTGVELLYAFREQLDETGLTLLGQMSGYIVNNQWLYPGEPDRYDRVHKGVLRDVEGAVFAGLADPEPRTAYRSDGMDWRNELAPNLSQVQAAKKVAVNQLKFEKENGVAPTPFGDVDNDDRSKIKMNGATTMAMLALQNGQPFSINWTMADNSSQPLDAAGMIQLGQAAGYYVAQLHDYAVALKGQIDAVSIDTTNPDQAAALKDAIAAVEAIDITNGWPS